VLYFNKNIRYNYYRAR